MKLSDVRKSDVVRLGKTLDEVEDSLVFAINENWSEGLEKQDDKELDVYLTRLKLVKEIKALYN